ncbi:hypothetical protein [Aerosakkonema funiforme]|uniref:hypothetical protein n=1 Tax=Aerosakkonema funiforme TaxID=1246630 RepID=UPI0035BB0A66
MSQQSQQPDGQQPDGQQPGWINWQLTVAIICMVLALTGPIPGFWDNVFKQVIVIRDKVFQSLPPQKNEIIIRKEVPVETIP